MRHRLLLSLCGLLFCTVPALAQEAAIQEAHDYLERVRDYFGLTAADISDLRVTDAYTSEGTGITHVYLRQRYAGIDIADANMTVNVNADGFVFYAPGVERFARQIAARPPSTTPSITAVEAAEVLAASVGLPSGGFQVVSTENTPDRRTVLSNPNVSQEPIPARLVYHMDEDRRLTLAWEVGIYTLDAQHYWLGRVDAWRAGILRTADLVTHDTWGPAMLAEADLAPISMRHPALAEAAAEAPGALTANTYRVYPIPVESPNHTTPLPPADARVTVSNPANATASPFGWHDTNGVAGAEFTTTQGNNVHAYTDTDANNSPDAGSSPDGTATLDFVFPIDLTQHPSAYRPAAVTNLFYWNNVIHDVLHFHGFNAASGNFQVNNYGGGGLGNDDVRAEAQDGSGTNNANFFTPVDGQRPRMQMFLGTSPNPDVDGDLDNAVIAHEYGHGWSNRLVGGPGNVSCLNNAEQMGEGWSDYLGLMLTMKAGDTAAQPRGIGSYLFGLPASGGTIRPAPYSTNFGTNNFTYQRTRTQAIPHGVGFVWATILWEVTWDMIAAHGFHPDIYNATGTAGNQIMLRLVSEAMKLTVCSPGFVNARDAILQADQNLYGGAHLFTLWTAFARRGLGVDASQGSSSTNADNTDGFQNIPVELVSFTGAQDGEAVNLTWETASETNNAGFEVQMRDEGDWRVLAFVEGHGTTTEAHTYSYRAERVPAGTNVFRLRQVDYDGAFAISPEVEVGVGVVGTHRLSEVYPNPFNPRATFTLAVARAQEVSVALYDAMGRHVATLFEGRIEADQTREFEIDGVSLASGAYLIRAIGETFAETQRMTLVK